MRADLDIIKTGSRPAAESSTSAAATASCSPAARPQAGQRLRHEIDPDNIAACIDKGRQRHRTEPRPRPWQLRQRQLRHGGDDPGAAGGALPRQAAQGNAASRPRVHHHLPQLRPLALPLVPASKGRMPVSGSSLRGTTRRTSTSVPSRISSDCARERCRVRERLAVDRDHKHGWASRLWPNLLGEIGIYRVTGPSADPPTQEVDP